MRAGRGAWAIQRQEKCAWRPGCWCPMGGQDADAGGRDAAGQSRGGPGAGRAGGAMPLDQADEQESCHSARGGATQTQKDMRQKEGRSIGNGNRGALNGTPCALICRHQDNQVSRPQGHT